MSKPWLVSAFQAMRPKQWTKNVVVLAAFVFALGDRHQNITYRRFLDRLEGRCSCSALVSSGIYLVNDVRDMELDRLHPTKKLRPLAAGEISTGTALGTGLDPAGRRDSSARRCFPRRCSRWSAGTWSCRSFTRSRSSRSRWSICS